MQREKPIKDISHELSLIQTEQQNNLVVKSNDIVRKGCYRLTSVQQKLLCYLISDLKDTDSADTVKEYDLKKLCDILGIPNEHNEHFKEFCDTVLSIANRHWWWVDGKDTVLLGFFNTVRLKGNKKLQVRYNPDILPHLQNLRSNFTAYKVFYVLDMKSSYSMRLYEILKSAEQLGTWRHEIDYLKKLLDCENYIFGNFKQKVLLPSIEEINQKTDLTVEYTLFKNGKAYTAIEFEITTKNQTDRLHAETQTRDDLNTVLLRNHKQDMKPKRKRTTKN